MIQLEPVQQELISRIVEAFRNVPSDKRCPFVILRSDESNFATVRHAGFAGGNLTAYEGDLNTLGRKGLIDLSAELGGSLYTFDVSPEGFAFYNQLRKADGKPIERIENRVTRYLSEQFQQKYARAYRKWKHADALLWESDTELQLTTIDTCAARRYRNLRPRWLITISPQRLMSMRPMILRGFEQS